MSSSTEREVLEREIGRLEAEGYDVFVAPGLSVAPPFLKDYTPDVVAIGKGKKVAIEIAGPTSAKRSQLARIAAQFESHPDWEFRIIWVEPTSSAQAVPVQSIARIEDAISEIEGLKRQGLYRPAFLLGWSAFEAASRALVAGEFARPQPPDRLVDVLSSEGYLEPQDADTMRILTDTRNRLVHGALDADVGPADVERLVRIIRSMTSEVVA
jgi:uncharacterized protein YutE (UPF0331/DUF86 family)/Holliday junction resolvase